MATVREVLSQMTDEFASAPRYNRWQPPDGPYIDIITKVDSKFYGEGTNRKPMVVIEGEIADGDYKGKRHCIGFFNPKMFGKMDDAYLAMGGKPTNNPALILDFFNENIGTPVATEVTTRKRKDTGEVMRNADIVGVVGQLDDAADTSDPEGTCGDGEPEQTEEEV